MHSGANAFPEQMAAELPSEPILQRAGDASVVSLSPTDATRFFFSGVPGQPDFFENVGGRGDSPPLHRRPWATWEVVLDGQIRFIVNGEEFVAHAGDFVYTPPNAAHTYVVESEKARMIGFNHPAPRFAELQWQVAPLFQDPDGVDMEKIVALAREYGLEILGPPLQPR